MATALKLYETTDELLTVREFLLESEDGELTPEMEQLLDHATGNFDEKVERVALVIRELVASAKGINDEAERLAARARSAERAASRLKAYLLAQLLRADVKKVERPLATVRVQANPPSVRSSLAPEAVLALRQTPLVRVIPERVELDSKSIITAWKAGEALPEGVTVEQGCHLRIA